MARARSGARAEAKRSLILDAAARVMLEHGYAGVTSRSIGAEAGVQAPLVHYYFPTLDDLFVALLQRGVEHSKRQFAAALASPRPLRTLWQQHLDPRGTSLTVELVALSNHRPAVRKALVEMSADFQRVQIAGFTELWRRYGVDTELFPPELAVIALGGVARVIVREQAMGMTVGHDAALAAISRLIARLEPEDDQEDEGG
ncbi:MAG TPA: TetR/AcrR family transcriptional regulator [Acidimicrobiales bacterium]